MILPYPFDNLEGMRMRSKVPFGKPSDSNSYYPEDTVFEVICAGAGGVELCVEWQRKQVISVGYASLFTVFDLIDECGNKIFLSKTFDTLAKVDAGVWKGIQKAISRKKPSDALKDILNGKITLEEKARESNRLVVCQGIKDLKQKLKEIAAWCSTAFKGHGLGESKHIVIIVEEWDSEKFDSCIAPYKEEFRHRAMHEDFWFFFVWVDENGYHEIPFLQDDLYDFTRHIVP